MSFSPPTRPVSSGVLRAFLGAALAWTAMVTYFLVVPRWPGLRDSGVPSVVLGLVGLALSVSGVRRSRAARRNRGWSWLLLGSALLPCAFLAFYVFVLTYQLPDPQRAIARGSAAPAFRLPDQRGRPWALADHRGRWIVLDFFRGHW